MSCDSSVGAGNLFIVLFRGHRTSMDGMQVTSSLNICLISFDYKFKGMQSTTKRKVQS